jgi:hypothetical protein
VVLRDEALAILVERPDATLDRAELAARISAALARKGAAALHVVVETVGALPRGPLGKAPLVRSARRHAEPRP